ncbi:phospholipase D-like domain-containing protein [Isoptericola sp. NEAU-Y5]|uniref:Phospholipase D-like domain-containing protein n=1 Tax=Isoptericola luteus TaxID=2879484 RepID=A0ABS7ZI62_9MICO|nr:phospholipase D-like domain-containing protein [Isoptericola sp. NEAU-Y5]MCA5894719.1 phospholipase D-like domain-containing protein [Isoptericola sp. NEAU-Y5]
MPLRPQNPASPVRVRFQVDWPTVRKLATRAALVTVAAPVVVAAGVMALERFRRHQYPLDAPFPTAPPASTRVQDTTATVYTYGADLYEAMLEAIEGARHQVFLETYIWKNDDVGEQFKAALREAADRGVEVYVVYDGFANLVIPRSFYDMPPGVHMLRFPAFRPGLLMLDVRHSGRNHRKILVVDDEIAFVGGYNIGTLYATRWRDTHLRIAGPSVWELRNAFVDFWNRWRTPDLPVLQDVGSNLWLPQLRAARNAPSELVFPIRGIYLDAIDRACSHIYITQAYFIPDADIHTALLEAAARGVDVRVLMPERSNHVVADWLARGLYSTLLRGGVRIFLYQGAMIHAKTATVDGIWTTVGTANIDRLSLTGNYEINLEVVDDGLAAELESAFRMDESNSRELTLDEWERRHPLSKIAERIMAPLRPLL